MAPFVLGLMYLLSPVAWPTAKLLDWLLGEDHGTVYKKAGLKTLVSLHKTLGDTGQKLNEDEVTIISAVLDLKDKAIGSIMTPMQDVYTLSMDDVLDEKTMDEVLSQGYSRIPIHHPDNDANFVGMLLVKMLITYDPEDAMPVRDFALATLPETWYETSCLDIVNFFQQGKSHMVLVSESPGDDHGALGVVTLEDVIEELIGEEIIDESDVFVDVHKAIRRLAPAPRTRVPRGQVVQPASTVVNGHEGDLIDINEGEALSPADIQRIKTVEGGPTKAKASDRSGSPRQPYFPIRRRSSAGDSKTQRYSTEEIREHLKHLGPSNLASRPKATRSKTVRIKPGGSIDITQHGGGPVTPPRRLSESASSFHAGTGEGIVTSGGSQAKDGVQAVQQELGGFSVSPTRTRPTSSASKGIQANPDDLPDADHNGDDVNGTKNTAGRDPSESSENRGRTSRSSSTSTIKSLRERNSKPMRSSGILAKGPARSGSITEQIVDANGIRKVVLEANSSSSSTEEDENVNEGRSSDKPQSQSVGRKQGNSSRGASRHGLDPEENYEDEPGAAAKKKRRKKRKPGNDKGEQEPLLGLDD